MVLMFPILSRLSPLKVQSSLFLHFLSGSYTAQTLNSELIIKAGETARLTETVDGSTESHITPQEGMLEPGRSFFPELDLDKGPALPIYEVIGRMVRTSE